MPFPYNPAPRKNQVANALSIVGGSIVMLICMALLYCGLDLTCAVIHGDRACHMDARE